MKINSIYQNKLWQVFLLFCLLQVTILILLDSYVLTPDKVREGLTGIVQPEMIDRFIEGEKTKWVHKLYQTPLLYMALFGIQAGSLCIACLFFNIKENFKDLMIVTIIANFAFIISDLIKLLYFLNKAGNYTIKDVNNFSPLSLASIYNGKQGTAVNAVLGNINLFQIGFVVLLLIGLKQVLKNNENNVSKIVLWGYGSLFIIYTMGLYLLTSVYSTHG